MFIQRNIAQLKKFYPQNVEQIMIEGEDAVRDLIRKRKIDSYLTKAIEASPHLFNGDVFVYLDYVQHNPLRLLNEEDEQNADLPKCSVRADKARQEGNRLYLEQKFNESLEKYNESICWAPGDSEDLAFGYANRSAVYYKMEEYELALGNIALAKKHNYPERLMPKLRARQLNCKIRIEANEHKAPKQSSKLPFNIETNPKIPFVAKGVAMQELPSFGRSMVAEKDFEVGDVILNEKPTMVSIGPKAKYTICQYCSSCNAESLIPCPRCVSVMYCSEECLTNGWKESHRFECGMLDRINSVPFDECRMAVKMFFYGLTLFNDDVEEMMKFCESHKRTGSNPFDLDYTKEDPLAAFKVFHMAKMQPRTDDLENAHRCIAAILYTIYIQQPLVRSLFVSQAHKNFLLKYIDDYLTVVNRLFIFWAPGKVNILHTVASVCNHSCDPNTNGMFQSGQLKFVVIRPIAKGEQVCISYGPVWWEQSETERQQELAIVEIDCACEVCNPNLMLNWLLKHQGYPPAIYEDFDTMKARIFNEPLTHADELNVLQQFIQRYAKIHPLEPFPKVLTVYRKKLSSIFADEVMAMMREKAYASVN